MRIVRLEAQSESAQIVPSLGCQCLEYRVGSIEIIAGAPSLEALRAAPFMSGIPILFPWPGRVAGGAFVWRGRQHALSPNETHRGHALHGLVYQRAFQVRRRGPYYAQFELNSADDSELARTWPYPFKLGIDYEVGLGLRIRAAVHNTGREPMPFGFGLHPYFRAPLAAGGRKQELKLFVPASKRWPLDERLIPAGQPIEVAGKFDLRSGRELADETYDDAFTALAAEADGTSRTRLTDPKARIAVELIAGEAFRELMVYVPGERNVVSLEPYTCAPDAFNLSGRGVDSGVRELAPGQSWQSSVEIRIAPLSSGP